MKWERSIEVFKSNKELEVAANLQNGIEKSLSTQKRQAKFRKMQASQLSERKERNLESLDRHNSLMGSIKQQKADETAKLNKKFRELSKRNEERSKLLTYQQELSRELNESRQRDNKAN